MTPAEIAELLLRVVCRLVAAVLLVAVTVQVIWQRELDTTAVLLGAVLFLLADWSPS